MSNYTGFGSINDTLILIVYNNIIYNIKYRKLKRQPGQECNKMISGANGTKVELF
jgi:hypothetical protein